MKPHTRPTEDQWRALVDRRPVGESPLIYAVTTTGIYCVNTCAARKPLRKNVAVFGTNNEARSAGFRPCKRCKPDAAQMNPQTTPAEHMG